MFPSSAKSIRASLLILFVAAVPRPGLTDDDVAAAPGAVQPLVLESYPSISGALVLEVQNDHAYHAQDRAAEANDLYSTIEPALAVAFNRNLSLQASLVFEPVEDAQPHQSREFDRQGLFAEELYALWESGPLSLRAGKMNPHFGQAWDLAPGLYGVDFAEDYELTERMGAGASYDLGNDTVGSHVLSLEAFFADTTHMSRSLVRGRSRVHRSDGGPSNTGRLNSFALTLQGDAIPAIPGLSYNLGWVRQSSKSGERAESDYVAGLAYALPISDTLGLEFLAEYVQQINALGEANRSRRYLTLSSAATWNDLVFALSYTNRDEDVRGDRDNNDYLLQVSAGYFRPMGPGLAGFEIGYKITREENLKIGTAGMRASYALEF